MTYYYLASPYTRYPHGQVAAWKLACKENARLIKAGVRAYSPIAHTFAVEINSDGIFDGSLDEQAWRYWMDFDHTMMEPAIGIIFLKAEGWEISKGMKEELETFKAAGKPVIYMTPGIIPFELLPIKMEDAVVES